jgi:hypothetical protein
MMPATLDTVHVQPCPNVLVAQLRAAGFDGGALRIAWAIAMRESKGHARSVSTSGDWGLFQFNKATWGDASWWDPTRLLDPVYNATVALRLSQDGRTWYPWDINGRGQHLGRYSSRSTYGVFTHYLDRYPCGRS